MAQIQQQQKDFANRVNTSELRKICMKLLSYPFPMESSAMPVCKENYLSGFGRDEFGACRAPDYSAPQSWSCFLMCSCGAPFHPLQSACVAGGGTNTRSHSRYLELIFWLLPRGHSCSTRAGASCRVNLLQGQARAGL